MLSFLKFCFILLNFILISSCGIKREPEPLPEPEFRVLRIGTLVYLIPSNKDVVPESFTGRGWYYVKDKPERFCFRVKHLRGKEALVCVPEAYTGKPSAEVILLKDSLKLLFKREGVYRVYPYREGLIPKVLKELRGREVLLERKHTPYMVAITELVGDRESEPLILEVPPRKPPEPPPPEGLRYVVREDRLILYWWSGSEDVSGFLVYRNGKLLTEKPIIQNVYEDRLPKGKTIYEVRSVNKFGVKSEPARIIYSP